MKKDTWRDEADKYLRDPPFKSKFSKSKSNSDAALVVRRRTRKEPDYGNSKDRVLRAVFASFLDLFCSTVPPDRRDKVKTEISSTLVELQLVPTVFFSDEFSNVRKAFSSLISNVLGNTFVSGPNIDSPLFSGGTSSFLPSALSSRYRSDFEELEEIGEGGFGTVYKVKSRMDNCCYAVKKIKLKRDLTTLSFRVLSEVQVLASLHHKNVVRYHCGWVEMEPPEMTSSAGWMGAEPGREPVPDVVKIIEIVDDVAGTSETESDDSTPVVMEGLETQRKVDGVKSAGDGGPGDGHVDVSTSTSFDPSFSASSGARTRTAAAGGRFWNGGGGESTASECETEETSVLVRETEKARENGHRVETPDSQTGQQAIVKLSWKPLVYIQMELCSMTLEDHLMKRNREKTFLGTPFVDGSFNRELTVQLLSAIEYIHSNGLIHRDIKPSNIFMKYNGPRVRFLLGDFGLACADKNILDEDCPGGSSKQLVKRRVRRSSVHVQHSRGVGTSTYAAPEQLKSYEYGPMVDIYSAGVVIFEAYSIFTTGMERVRAIEDLRKHRKVTERMQEQWPTVIEMVLRMTDPSPTRRPTASQLLQKYKTDESSTVVALREIISEQEHELKALRAELLRLKVAELERKHS